LEVPEGLQGTRSTLGKVEGTRHVILNHREGRRWTAQTCSCSITVLAGVSLGMRGDCMLRWFNREDALYIIATAYIIAVGGWAVYVLARYFVG
jgi:hypothetical protein